MDPKALKTTISQRITISVIAVLLLGSTIATYIGIILSNSNGDKGSTSQLENEYTDKQTEISNYSIDLSDRYFDTFVKYRSEIKAYNAEAANSTGVIARDLLEGTGRELTTGDLAYFAYYIGFCPDESIFDSSFNDKDNPTSLNLPIYAGQGLIEGWNTGVVGMKVGGIREIQMPGEQAYGETREICGMTNSPLKFIVMTIDDEKLFKLYDELEDIYARLSASNSNN